MTRAAALAATPGVRRVTGPLAALALAGLFARLVIDANAVIGGAGFETARALGASCAMFAVAGFGLTRMFLPEALRAREALWTLPVGACAASLGLTVLGFAAVPLHLAIGVVFAAGVAVGAVALRRRPVHAWRLTREQAWPAYIAVLLVAVVLVPMVRLGFPTVAGAGSDAYLAVGTAQFLQHSYPTSENFAQPVDRMPLVWRSKYPIYYALGAVSSLSGLEPYQAFTPLIALMLGLAALGVYLVARELLGAGLAAGLAAMGLAGLDRMVLHTGLHPYFNQTWGYFTLPFALVLAWTVVERRSGRALGLLVLFLALGAFAYPLALPIPLVGLAVFSYLDRRERRRSGQDVRTLRSLLPRGRPARAALVAACVLLALPAFGVLEKLVTALRVVLPGHSLANWSGDLPPRLATVGRGFIPSHHFFDIAWSRGWEIALAVLIAGALVALARLRRPLAGGLLAVLAFGLLAGLYFRQRDFGWYFQFKALAFTGPLLVAVAAIGLARLRLLGATLLAALLVSSLAGARSEVIATQPLVRQPLLDLRSWSTGVPASASIRLDMDAGHQLWPSLFLSRHPLCSQLPLVHTNYPRVPYSRRADYVLVGYGLRKPFDAVGPPLRRNVDFRLYRMDPRTPGADRCSRRAVESVTRI